MDWILWNELEDSVVVGLLRFPDLVAKYILGSLADERYHWFDFMLRCFSSANHFFFKGAIFQDVQVVIVSDAQFHFPQPIKFITIKPPNLGICFLRRSMEIPWEPRILQSCKMECLAAHLAAAAAVPGRPQLLRWRSRDPLMAMQKCWRKSGTSWYSNTAIYYIYSNHSL